MAKSKSFFGLRTGSTKSLTFQVYRGEQITKDRVYRVSNPRTEAQMMQRALIPIVAAARAALKGLVDHSFEGVPYGEPSLKEFSKKNLRAGALQVTSYSPNGVSNPGFANLIVSNGSINTPYKVETSDPSGNSVTNGIITTPKLSFPAAKAGDSADAIFKYLETYARTNSIELIAPGTQLTFLTIYGSGFVTVDTGAAKKDVPTSGFLLNRIYIPNGDSDSENAKAINDQWKVMDELSEGASSVDLVNEIGDQITIECGGEATPKSKLNITIKPKELIDHENNTGMACILSRYENGVWKRSPSRLKIVFKSEKIYTFEDWLSTYQTTGAASKKYLNTGDESTGIRG